VLVSSTYTGSFSPLAGEVASRLVRPKRMNTYPVDKHLQWAGVVCVCGGGGGGGGGGGARPPPPPGGSRSIDRTGKRKHNSGSAKTVGVIKDDACWQYWMCQENPALMQHALPVKLA
jgi:hypothetical protein